MLATHLAPVLAAEKSKTAYYVAGGLLVAWALIVSVLFGLRKPDFPGSLGGQRIVMAISAVLVLAAASTAVITSGGAEKAGAEKASGTQAATAPQATGPPAQESTTAATPSPAASSPAKSPKPAKPSPKATTGTPAPASSPAAATMLKLAANPAGQLAYDTKQLSAKAGKVTIDMTNTSPIEHDVAVAQGSTVAGQTAVFTGGSKSVTLTLKPGTYKFYCTVPGHRQAGMEGTLTVS
ncbi:MAG TPA: plastocyanin/azurin family copper-binding protein [Solirubrobacteraceae bacterium]|nr:plastocyanin/azurin family copper-binding protein [Solirubrobacteraceae bacterium]